MMLQNISTEKSNIQLTKHHVALTCDLNTATAAT